MKFSSIRALAIASLAWLAMAMPASSATILTYAQQNNTDVVKTTVAAGVTTFSTGAAPGANPINVQITTLGGVPAPPNTFVPETFSFTSSAAVTGSGGNFTQGGFSGSFTFGGQLVANIANGVLSTQTGPGGTTGSFESSNVTFSTLGGGILSQLGNPILSQLTGTISISLNSFNQNPLGSIVFTAQNAGLITANVIPEPASVVMASVAVVAGLGCFGLRRFKASRA
jgi:hypothetical protein